MKNKEITIKYYTDVYYGLDETKFELDTMLVYGMPFRFDFMQEIHKIPFSYYDFPHHNKLDDLQTKKCWIVNAEYGNEVEAIVRKHFPDISITVLDLRKK